MKINTKESVCVCVCVYLFELKHQGYVQKESKQNRTDVHSFESNYYLSVLELFLLESNKLSYLDDDTVL